MEDVRSKMVVEIWSDIMCPFCYLGKRRFEAALTRFEHRDQVRIIWRSFQLMPGMKTVPSLGVDAFLAREKRLPLDYARQMNARVAATARAEGLTYNFDRAVVANSFRAHRFLHFSRRYGVQNEAKERLFRAYFTEGKNIDDDATLVALGSEIGLDGGALARALADGSYSDEVTADVREARQIGIGGVPFFVFDRKYAVSGAQESPVFLEVLQKSFAEWRTSHPALTVEAAGPDCSVDGACD